MTTWATGEDLTKAEEKDLRGLIARNRDIYEHGAKALEFMAEKQAKLDKQQEWVEANGLSCFGCGATTTTWAKGGRRKNGLLYVICLTCVRKPK